MNETRNTIDIIVNPAGGYTVIIINGRPQGFKTCFLTDIPEIGQKTEDLLYWLKRHESLFQYWSYLDRSLPLDLTMGTYGQTSRPLTLAVNGPTCEWTLEPTE